MLADAQKFARQAGLKDGKEVELLTREQGSQSSRDTVAQEGLGLDMLPLPQRFSDKAKEAAARIDADVFLFNGGLEPRRDLETIEAIYASISRPGALLLLVTNGGNPDIAYKITRYFHEKYEHLTVLVSGKCKSAGTLIAIGAHELVFTPYGELGPLDIQLSKVDRFDQLQSGLTIQEALNTLEARALDKFYQVVRDYMQANNGLLSFASATKAASDFVTQLYAPVFSRIDPEEVGARARSMKIAADYGQRLAIKSQNLKNETLRLLSETYSSHSFVIDYHEAETLFKRVRIANDAERDLVAALGVLARFEAPTADFVFHALSEKAEKGTSHDKPDAGGNPPENGGDSARTDGTASAPPPRRRRQPVAQNGERIWTDAQG